MQQRLLQGGIKAEIKDVLGDLADGQLLARLLETLSGQKYGGKLASGQQRIQQISQASDVLKWAEHTLKVDLKAMDCFFSIL